MTTRARHVIFGTGAIGLALLDALHRRGETARLVNRSGSADVSDEIEVIGGDARDPAFTTEVARGAQVVYQTLNPPYAEWVHVADDDEAKRAIRGLSGCRTLHIHHHGHHRQSDFILQRPTP